MNINRNSKIAIVGFGVEGRAVYNYFNSKGFEDITICDFNSRLEVPQDVKTIFGEKYLDKLNNFEFVFRSPGIKFFNPKIQQAIASGVTVTSVIKFFVHHCPCKIIGVSGTKGKGTTSTLIYQILKNAGIDAYLGGNIGEPAINFLDKLNSDSIAVLELSSFQLQDLDKSPQISVLLNTTQDHLDWHQNKEEYWQAKSNLLKFQDKNDLAILNADYEYKDYFEKFVCGELKLVSSQKETLGCYQKDGNIFYNGEKIISVDDIGLLGKHNWENVMPAIVVSQNLNIDREVCIQTIKDFKGLPYRLELIKEINGVEFYNDSFSTNPETSIAGVKSFDKPLALIAGGYDKGLDYNHWAKEIISRPNLKNIFLIGDLAEKMNNILNNYLSKNDYLSEIPEIKICNNFESAIKNSYESMRKISGIVLLSPAAASFDMFANYKERGQKFVEIVNTLDD